MQKKAGRTLSAETAATPQNMSSKDDGRLRVEAGAPGHLLAIWPPPWSRWEYPSDGRWDGIG